MTFYSGYSIQHNIVWARYVGVSLLILILILNIKGVSNQSCQPSSQLNRIPSDKSPPTQHCLIFSLRWPEGRRWCLLGRVSPGSGLCSRQVSGGSGDTSVCCQCRAHSPVQDPPPPPPSPNQPVVSQSVTVDWLRPRCCHHEDSHLRWPNYQLRCRAGVPPPREQVRWGRACLITFNQKFHGNQWPVRWGQHGRTLNTSYRQIIVIINSQVLSQVLSRLPVYQVIPGHSKLTMKIHCCGWGP